MALNTLKCNHLTPLGLKKVKHVGLIMHCRPTYMYILAYERNDGKLLCWCYEQ